MLTLAPALMAAPSNVYAQNKASQTYRTNSGIYSARGFVCPGLTLLYRVTTSTEQNQNNEGNNVGWSEIGGSGKGSGNPANRL